MYEADVERLEAQARRVRQAAAKLLDNAETLEEDGHDTSTSNILENNQDELVENLEQLLADGAAALDNCDCVERRPTYDVGADLFSVSISEGTATVTYNGDVQRNPSDISVTVTVDGAEKNVFSGAISPGDTYDVDVSGASGSVEVSWVGTLDQPDHPLPSQSQSPVDRSNLPEPNTTANTQDFSSIRNL